MCPAVSSLQAVARARIRSWTHASRMRQTDLAARIGKNQAWLSRYLAGTYDADLDTLNAIAHVFGHTIGALLDTPTDPAETQLIERWRAMPPSARAAALTLFDLWAPPRRSRRSRRSPAHAP